MAALKWRRMKADPRVTALVGDRMKTLQAEVPDGHLTVFVSRDDGLFHLSISHRTNDHPPVPGRYPTWDEIKEARYLFAPAEVTMAMLLPPESEFVNVHETTFHLWEVKD